MPNPRYMSDAGIPTPELLEKMHKAKQVMYANLPWFCEKYAQDIRELGQVDSVFLIGSHAKEEGWMNETSDLDLKIINTCDTLTPEYLHRFRREVLRPLLCQGEKHRWIDLYFVQRDDQALPPRYDLTGYWNRLELGG